jgi:3-phenylpropionate/trans-cinnamate dioxygenase ferredoxin reductase subunit
MHEEHGVVVRTGTGVSALTGAQGRVAGVVLGTGEEVPADLVLFGIGRRRTSSSRHPPGSPSTTAS